MRQVSFARPGRMLFATLAAALATGFGASPALAAPTWTITPGGAITLSAGKTTFKDSKTGTVFTCTSATLSGSLKPGGGHPGTGIGSIAGGNFVQCTGPLGIVVTFKAIDLPWHINLTSYSASGVVKGTISHMELSATAPSCAFVVDGTAGGASDGIWDFSYSDGTHLLKLSGGDLHVYNVSGCFGLVDNGDPVTFTASFKIAPAQTITSP